MWKLLKRIAKTFAGLGDGPVVKGTYADRRRVLGAATDPDKARQLAVKLEAAKSELPGIKNK